MTQDQNHISLSSRYLEAESNQFLAAHAKVGNPTLQKNDLTENEDDIEAHLDTDVKAEKPALPLKGMDKSQDLDENPFSLFLFAMNSPETKQKYVTRLKKFFQFIGLNENGMEENCKIFVVKSRENANTKYALNNVIKFLQMNKDRVERKEITGATVRNYVKTIKLFCEMNEILLPWKRITRGLPKARKYANDRSPTIEEIRKVSEYPDRRIRAILFTMVSSGIRLGAWDFLQWKHVIPIVRDDKTIAAKLIVYPTDPEEYFTFITPEAFLELEKWMNYRKRSGENITKDSWIMRNIWDSRIGAKRGKISEPRKLKSIAVKRLMETALWTQGLRKKLPAGQKRHEFQTDHGYRKWFKTRCELSSMKSINIEILMGHSIGISDSYYRATEKELLEDYLKAIDYLTISNEHKLKMDITNIVNTSNENYSQLKSDIYNKEVEITSLRQKEFANSDAIAALSEQVISLAQEIDTLKRKSSSI